MLDEETKKRIRAIFNSNNNDVSYTMFFNTKETILVENNCRITTLELITNDQHAKDVLAYWQSLG